jgi:hypothetical protein
MVSESEPCARAIPISNGSTGSTGSNAANAASDLTSDLTSDFLSVAIG